MITQFDTLDVEKNIVDPTVRERRELFTYGAETSIDLAQLNRMDELILTVQRETIRIVGESREYGRRSRQIARSSIIIINLRN